MGFLSNLKEVKGMIDKASTSVGNAPYKQQQQQQYSQAPQPAYQQQQQPGPYRPPAGGYGPPQGYAPPPARPGFQGGPYAQPPRPQGPPQGGPPVTLDLVRSQLEKTVYENNLGAFYNKQQVANIANRLGAVNFYGLASKFQIPHGKVVQLASLALYDVVIYADDSGSMSFEEQGRRIPGLRQILSNVAEIATNFDDDGIQVRFINSTVEGNGIRNARDANALVDRVKFNGATPIGTNLEKKILRPLVYRPAEQGALRKPVLVVAITDGEPMGESRDTLTHVIKGCKEFLRRSRYGPNAVAFQFAQIGNDVGAQEFLAKLDSHRSVGDIVDVTSSYELEYVECKRSGVELTFDMWTMKLMLGAIDRSYDAKDQ